MVLLYLTLSIIDLLIALVAASAVACAHDGLGI